MIPKITQAGPNIMPQFWCSTCRKKLMKYDPLTRGPSGWEFCPRCGDPIEWDKAGPPLTTQLTVKVTFDDGDTITTKIDGTETTVKNHYPIGSLRNIGSTHDRWATITDVEIIGREEIPLETPKGW